LLSDSGLGEQERSRERETGAEGVCGPGIAERRRGGREASFPINVPFQFPSLE